MNTKTNVIKSPTLPQVLKEVCRLPLNPTKNIAKHKFKIIEVKKTKGDLHELLVHVVGKGKFYRILAEELVNDDLLLDEFSQLDVRTICGYAFQDLKSPKYKLVSSYFDYGRDGLIKIKKKGKKKPVEKSISEFLKDEDFVENLSSKEALKLGYKKAEIDFQSHRRELENLRKEMSYTNLA